MRKKWERIHFRGMHLESWIDNSQYLFTVFLFTRWGFCTTLSLIFQLYRVCQFYCCEKAEYLKWIERLSLNVISSTFYQGMGIEVTTSVVIISVGIGWWNATSTRTWLRSPSFFVVWRTWGKFIEEFEDTENTMAKRKRTNNDLQNIHIKLNIE